MDPITIIGIILCFVSLIGMALMEGTHLQALVAPSAMVIIFGGTCGATIACYSLSEVLAVIRTTKKVFQKVALSPEYLYRLMTDIATVARRQGVLALDNYPLESSNPLLKRGLRLVIDGTPPEVLRELLVTEATMAEEKAKGQASIYQTAGGFAPTMGIIGTVVGLVHVLSNLSEPEKLGAAIATAFLATLYGISSANMVFLPLGKKLVFAAKEETKSAMLIIEALLAIQGGDSPRLVQEKMLSLVDEDKWEAVQAAAPGGQAGQAAKEKA